MADPDDLDKLERSPDDRYGGKYDDPYGGQYGSDDPGHYKKTYGPDELKGDGKTSPPTGNLSATPKPADLAKKEKATDPDRAGRGYTGTNKRQARKWLFNKRRKALGGGIIGVIIGLIFFTFVSGPLQFVHVAQLLEQFHFTTGQTQQDNRFLKQIRFIRFSSRGEVEKTRMGYLGNKFSDKFEAKLNASGYESAYSSKFGLFDGYVIDTQNEKFKGKTIEQIKSIVRAETGLDVVDGNSLKRTGLNDKLVIPTGKLGYFQTRGLMKTMLGQAGYSKLSSAIGTRLMCVRAACTLHPLNKLANRTKGALESWWSTRNQEIEKGTSPKIITHPADTTKAEDPKQAAADAAAADAEAQATAREAETAASKAATGDQSGITANKAKIATRVSLGAASLTGVACILKGLDDNAANIKQEQVVLPLIRQAMDFIALGNKIRSSQGSQEIDPNQLGKYAQLLNGVDASGKQSSWVGAQSIQAELGNQGGVPPSDTLKTITTNSPFHFLNEGSVGTVMGGVCNSIVQGVVTVVGFLGASITSVAAFVAQSLLAPTVLNAAANWLAGQAVSPVPVGADAGNQINYGARLAANDQAIASGGTALSETQAQQLKSAEVAASTQDFQRQSVFHKLFSTSDSRSALGKVIDQGSPSLSHNLAVMGGKLFNIGHFFGSLTNLFSRHVQAAAAPFDYGFSKFGFSAQEMDNPAAQNPYQNASDVEQLLSGSNGQTYIDKASKCFGVTITPDTTVDGQTLQQWNVTSSEGASPKYSDIASNNCADSSDANWLKVRFFILDTTTMNSMACYEGDEQACSDIGFSSTITSETPGSSSPTTDASGSYQNPLRDVPNLIVGRIDQGVDYGGSGKIYALGNGKINTVTTGAAWPGGTFINYTLSDGPAVGKNVFVAEHCTPVPGLGTTITTVTSSTVLCNMTGGANAIETGWAADPSKGFIAAAYDVYKGKTDGDPTAFGQNFSDFLKSIGAPPGDISQSSSRILLGTLPPGWPSW